MVKASEQCRLHARVKLPKPSWWFTVFQAGPPELAGMLDLSRPPVYGDVPPEWTARGGTEPEYAIDWGLRALGYSEENGDYQYQDPVNGGRSFFGGVIVDFLLFFVPIAINVQGLYWHYERGTPQLVHDAGADYALAKVGYQMIPIDADHALADPKFYVQEAILGINHSRADRTAEVN